MVLYGVYVVGRERRYIEASLRLGSFLLLVVLYGVCIVGRQRRHLKSNDF